MYISNDLRMFRIVWTEIATHTYERVSRAKWRVYLNYRCGAAMTLDNIPDDVIQCLVLGAYNSRRPITTDRGEPATCPDLPVPDWAALQDIILAEP